MRALLTCLAAALLAAGPGCSGTPSPYAVGEPINVHEGVFKSGPLPSSREADDGSVPGPRITSLENANAIVQLGQAGKVLEGRTTPEAYSVALRFAGAGSGYFVLPVGAVDPTANGERVFTVTLDFSSDLPAGLGALEVVALDEQGRAGPLTVVRLCVISGQPGGQSACDPDAELPAVVIALEWDTNVDLDLAVMSVTRQVVDWNHPSSSPDDLEARGAAVITRNSNAGCAIDGINREEIVWPTEPTSSPWLIYANLFDACGQPSVNYRVRVFKRQGNRLEETNHARGFLDSLAANGGATMGTFVLEVNLL